MKQRWVMLMVLLLMVSRPIRALETGLGDDFAALEQHAGQLLIHSDTSAELDALNQELLELYLWSKDNLEPRQTAELMAPLTAWPGWLRQAQKRFKGNDLARLRSIEAAYWLLLHDYAKARQLVADLPQQSIGPYPALIEALLGEQDADNPGIWRIPLEQARILVRRHPQQELAYLLLAESILERVSAPGGESGLLQEAQWAIRQVLKQNPHQLFAHYQQGQLLYLRGRTASARTYFEQQVSSHGALAAEAVGNFYVWMQETTTALAFYEMARHQRPRDLRLYQKMEPLYLQTQPEEALALYLKGLAQSPDETPLYLRLQSLYSQLSPERLKLMLVKYLPAAGYMNRLILGDLAVREDDLRSAEHWYQKALEQQPQRVDAYVNLLRLYWDHHETERMTQLLASARERGLRHAELDYWQGTLALQQGQPERAVALLEPLVEQDPRARYTLAMAYRQQQQYDKARLLLNKLIEQDPQNVMLVLTLGDIYRDARSYDQAEQVYLLAERMDPYQPAVAFSLGLLYSETGRYDAAIAALDRAILIAPDNMEYRNNLGNALLRSRRTGAAIEIFEAILTQQPDMAEVHYNLACAYALTGSNTQALEHLSRALTLLPHLKQQAHKDADLDSLRADPRFQELMH